MADDVIFNPGVGGAESFMRAVQKGGDTGPKALAVVLDVGGSGAESLATSSVPVTAGGVYHASLPTLSDGDRGDLECDANGILKVAIASGGGTGGTASSFSAAFPATGTACGFVDSTGVNMAAGSLSASGNINVNIAEGGGTGGTASNFAAAFPAMGTALGAKNGANMVFVGADASNNLNVNVAAGTVGLVAGTEVIGHVIVDTLPATPAGTNVIGHVIVDTAPTTAITAAALPLPAGASTAAKQPALGTAGTASADVLSVQGVASMTPLKVDASDTTQPVSLAAATAGGSTSQSWISAATINATKVKATAGQVYGYAIHNTTASPKWVKLYDKGSDVPDPASDTPVRRLLVPALGTDDRAIPGGIAFANGIGFVITAALADTDTTAVAAGDVVVNLDWK